MAVTLQEVRTLLESESPRLLDAKVFSMVCSLKDPYDVNVQLKAAAATSPGCSRPFNHLRQSWT